MNVKQYFSFLNIIHMALIAGQLVFIAIVLFLLSSGAWEVILAEQTNVFLIIVAVSTAGGVYLGNLIYSRQLASIKQLTDFKEQLAKLKLIIIMRFALLEGPMFLSILFYLFTGSWFFMVFAVFLILLFLKLKPNKEQIISDLELSDEIKKLLENPDTIIE